MQKRLVLVCEDSLCPRKQPDVSGHGRGTGTIGTGRTDVAHGLLALDIRDVAKRGRSWLGIGRRGRRSLKEVSM